MRKKIILIVIVIVVVLGFVIYQFFIKKEKQEFVLEKVAMGTVSKGVSETGMVKISEETKLGFKNAGRIEKILVKVGDVVEAGNELAKIGTNQLYIELAGAKADLEVAKAKKTDAQISLEAARQDLKDIEVDAQENLKNSYETVVTTLNSSYSQLYNALNFVREFIEEYVSVYDEDGRKIMAIRDKIEGAGETAKFYLETAKRNPEDEDIETALSIMRNSIETTFDDLETIREISKGVVYREKVLAADMVSLETLKTNINNALTNIISAQQTISTTKITNETNINNAEAKVSALEIQLKEEGENIGLYPAQVNQYLAKISLLQNQIQEAVLKSPNEGQITKINKREGEIVQPTDWVVSFLPKGKFQIEVDIYEEDIVDVKIGDPVEIFIPAFPNENLKGRVVLINPAEKMVSGVVYYETTINLMDLKEGIKPGMTADIIIETNRKENVLVVSKKAVKKQNGTKTVKVLNEKNINEREVQTGVEGDGLIEIISGLKEGEEVIIE